MNLTAFSLILIVLRCASARFIIEMDPSNAESCARPTYDKYEEMRADFMQRHLERALGFDVELNEDEKELNKIIMKFKVEELSRGFQNPSNFTPSRHFFDVYESIESSPLFKFIQRMPKGLCAVKFACH